MFQSYEYTSIIQDINTNIKHGLITKDDYIAILRQASPVFENYHPVLDWYLCSYAPSTGEFEILETSNKPDFYERVKEINAEVELTQVKILMKELQDYNSPFGVYK